MNWFIFEEEYYRHLGDVNGDNIDSQTSTVKKVRTQQNGLGTGLLNADVNKDKSVDSTDVTLLKDIY